MWYVKNKCESVRAREYERDDVAEVDDGNPELSSECFLRKF